ncbi:MAG TPA: glycosyltransferase [Flavobacteriales bacterium]|nr:glycosyltransferase [Flavobacteriales bacterium]
MRILYFCPSFSSFVVKDIEILKEFAHVDVFVFAPSAKWKTPLTFIRQKLFILSRSWKCDVYISQFGGYHSFMPSIFARLFNKRSVIVAGGTDCVSFPKMHYGNFQNKLLGLITKWSYLLCSDIWPVDTSLIKTQSSYDSEQNQPQGILQYCPNTKARIEVIYNGYSSELWNLEINKKTHSFISVAAGAGDYKRFILKGLDLIVKTAKKFPHYHFTIVGNASFNFEIQVPENVKLISFADSKTLESLYQSHQYYLQLSISEGFPNAICEAMLCGCIPIASNVAALPKIVGDTGYILNHRDENELMELINKLPQPTIQDYNHCRNRIQIEFPIQTRSKHIKQILLVKQ